jgi:hypothetical protein
MFTARTVELLAVCDTSGPYLRFEIDFIPEDSMDILAAIKREERKLEKQLGNIQQRLNGVRAAAKVLGNSTGRELKVVKKRVMSAAARAKIGRAAKKRWAKFRAQAKKAAG